MSTSQGAVVVLCSMEGNCRSGIATGMHHRLCGIYIYCELNGLRKVDEYPTETPVKSTLHLYFPIVAVDISCTDNMRHKITTNSCCQKVGANF